MKHNVVENVFNKKLQRGNDMIDENRRNENFLRMGRKLMRKKLNIRQKLLNNLSHTFETKARF